MTKIDGPVEVPKDFYKMLDEAAAVFNSIISATGPYLILGCTQEGALFMSTNLSGGDAAIAQTLINTAVKIADPDTTQIILSQRGEVTQ